MASISNDPAGRRRILFTSSDGSRRTIRLGKVERKQAEAVRIRVEKLSAASLTSTAVDDETSRWIADLDDAMHDKLSAVGLVNPRKGMTIRQFTDRFIADRLDVKPATAVVFGHTRRCLVEFFGEKTALRGITPGDADRWRLWLVGENKLAEATVGRRCGIAKQIFKSAMRNKLIETNPFVDLKSRVRGDTGRAYFLTREDAKKVLDACPDAQWRLLFALSRYGGLRCPSEHLMLKWSDVNWERGRMLVHSPKTEHHEGKATRWLPIFPELRPYLMEAFEQAEPGTEYVITRFRSAATNLRTQMLRIINCAGLTSWPKLFHNLRATRQTELAETFPIHVVCSWLGNSRAVAMEHYLQVTDAHFDKATVQPDDSVRKVAQNPAQYTSETGGNPPQPSIEQHAKKTGFTEGFGALRDNSEVGRWAVSGSNG